jgi:hypothetical protein
LIKELERKLDSFDATERKYALSSLCELIQQGNVTLPEPITVINLHCHTFFSYNSYGYSPSKFAWLARKEGLAVAGTVDFDVLDAVEEFLEACEMVGLKGCAGLETRVFVPEFANKEMTSPGEPGITYHTGVGFTKSKLEGKQNDFLLGLCNTAQKRNRDLTDRVNKYLNPIQLDYDKDVLTLTPSGNPTERHICLAYARKAQKVFANEAKLANFWTEKLGVNAEPLGLPEGRDLLNTVRTKTMKRGGVGYVQPDKGSFPLMADVNKFILTAGAIPTLTWLNGLSKGEQQIENLIDIAKATGTAAINIIPDRNYTPGVKDRKLQNLYDIVELAQKRHLPVVAGTEMNSPGQKFVDSFETKELSPLVPTFLKGALIIYAHSAIQQNCDMGYTSNWAKENFKTTEEKNTFFEEVGRLLHPQKHRTLTGLKESLTPKDILEKISNS